ncbi:MAG: hypothetical protein KR126chlam5_00055 [Candidatus Anoxychlamydiales bacterium]|nr:hypothetical protein [Candidatus Anoxychlamydiales bacterium]
MKKTGRNDPCVCGSGKKFKKCCERKMIGKKFMATKIEAPKTTSNIASFFQRQITQVNTNDLTNNQTNKNTQTEGSQVENPKKINATINENQDQNILLNIAGTQKS